MKIVVDGAIFELQKQGGVSRVFREILPGICDADPAAEITLLHGRGCKGSDLPQHPRITRRLVPRLQPGGAERRSLRGPTHLLRKLWRRAAVRSDRRTIWHSTYFTRPDHWKGTQVVTVHDMIYERFPEFFARPEDQRFREEKRRCVLAADAIVCVSDATREDVERFYELEPGRTHVIPNAASEVFRRQPSVSTAPDGSRARPFLLYVGARHQYKNFVGLMRAYGTWRLSGQCDLVVVGGGEWTSSERELIGALGLENRVELLLATTDESLRELYSRAAAFVYPSLYEGFGIPLLEAMACGCPIVASRIPSTVEVAGDYPVYFDANSVEELREALSSALEHPDHARLVGAGKTLASQFSWERTASQTLDVYRSLLADRV